MTAKHLSTLLLGVVILGATMAEENLQSEGDLENDQPMTNQETNASKEQIASQENSVGMRPLATPEVVLQLKYDGGELNRIYLTQFRKGVTTWVPSVPARIDLCTDLCHAGLGGKTCGDSCAEMIPVGLQSALQEHNSNLSVMYGQPRVLVCPTLCHYGLGRPLCGCEATPAAVDIDWKLICNAFCASGGYKLRGCPECEEASAPVSTFANRVLNTVEGWSSWCNVQCVQGHGGAACNCDRSPFL